MSFKIVVSDSEEAKKYALQGVKLVSAIVGKTLGVNGETIRVQKMGGGFHLTKDGVTVAKNIRVSDQNIQSGVEPLVQVALQILKRVGDGTTTAVLFGASLFESIVNYNLTPMQKKKILKYSQELIDFIDVIKYKADNFEDEIDKTLMILAGVAHVSSNGDEEITKLVLAAITHAKTEGSILIEDSGSPESSVENFDGFYIPLGMSSTFYVTNIPKKAWEAQKCKVFIYDGVIDQMSALEPFLQIFTAKNPGVPLLFITRGVVGTAEIGLIANARNIQNPLSFCAVTVTGSDQVFDDLANDLAASTGATVCGAKHNKILGANGTTTVVDLSHLGSLESAFVDMNRSILVPNAEFAPKIKEMASQVSSILSKTTNKGEFDYLSHRLSTLVNKVAVIKVGGETISTMMEKKDRIDDAVCAVKSAVKDGVVYGGGKIIADLVRYMCFVEAGHMDDDKVRFVLEEAFNSVLKRLFHNFFYESLRSEYEDEAEWSKKAALIWDELVLNNNQDPDIRDRMIGFIEILPHNVWFDFHNYDFANYQVEGIYDPAAVWKEILKAATEFAVQHSGAGGIITFEEKFDWIPKDPMLEMFKNSFYSNPFSEDNTSY